MINTKIVTVGTKSLRYTYSDAGCYVVRDGITYVEAYDVLDSRYTYVEGDVIPEEATEKDYLEALAKLGVSEDEET